MIVLYSCLDLSLIHCFCSEGLMSSLISDSCSTSFSCSSSSALDPHDSSNAFNKFQTASYVSDFFCFANPWALVLGSLAAANVVFCATGVVFITLTTVVEVTPGLLATICWKLHTDYYFWNCVSCHFRGSNCGWTFKGSDSNNYTATCCFFY